MIEVLDKNLVNVLKKQEADYLKGYSIYVKQKEKDLKDIITRISANNSDNDQKDRKIFTLQQSLDSLNKERVRMDKEKQELQERVKHWMARAQGFEQDMHTLQNQIIESKRQNKLLKLALGRLEGEMAKKDQMIEDLGKPIPITMGSMADPNLEGQGNTFMTEAKQVDQTASMNR